MQKVYRLYLVTSCLFFYAFLPFTNAQQTPENAVYSTPIMVFVVPDSSQLTVNTKGVNAPISDQIIFEKKEHHFGTIKPQTQVEYIFKFKNTATSAVKIMQAEPLKNATIAFTTEIIPPQGTGFVKIRVSTEGVTALDWRKTFRLTFQNASITPASSFSIPLTISARIVN